MPFYRCIPPTSGGGGGGSGSCEHISVVDNGVTYEPMLNFNTCVIYMTKDYGYADFNSPITVGDKVLQINGLCRGCPNFNSPVNMINATNLSRIYDAFYHCDNFNQPVRFPDSNLAVYSNVFLGATKYNQPTTFYINSLSTSVGASLYQSLSGCTEFNSKVDFNLGANIKSVNYYSLLHGATSFNQPLLFRKSSRVTNVLNNATNMECPLLIEFSNEAYASYQIIENTKINTVIILNYSNFSIVTSWRPASSGITYYVDDVATFTSKAQWLSIAIQNGVSFTQVTNGVYNAAYNIYVLNNVNDGCNYFNNFYYNFYGEYPIY